MIYKENIFFRKMFIYTDLVSLRYEFNGIMNTSGLLQSKCFGLRFTLTLQDTLSIHDSINIPKIEFIAYIYILLQISKI